jgi:hypothetical protein
MFVPPTQHWKQLWFHPTLGPSLEASPGAVDEDGSQLYEIVHNRKDDSDPGRRFQPVFDIFPDIKQWRSRDLVKKVEADGETFYSFQGRLDDILILSTALKVTPIHLEVKISGHVDLSGCLVFGSGQMTCGLLIEPKRSEELIEAVWPYVEEANATVPEHARVTKDKIVVAGPQSFPRAGKGTIVRNLTYKVFEKEIEAVYVS